MPRRLKFVVQLAQGVGQASRASIIAESAQRSQYQPIRCFIENSEVTTHAHSVNGGKTSGSFLRYWRASLHISCRRFH